MEIRLLRYFVAVAETRHFGQAAQRLHMAQPPLSQAIRQLEADLGAELFARTTRRVDLTEAGQALYTDALRILRSLDDSARRVRRIAGGSHGLLRVGLTGSAAYRQLPKLAGLIKRELPGVALEIHSEMLTPAQEAALLDTSIDLGVLRPPTREDGISHRTVATDRLVAALPQEHWLAGESAVGVGDLRAEHFVMYSGSSVVNDAVVRSCLAAGFYPHREHEVGETSILLALVAAGLGVALVPESVRSIALEGVAFVPVGEPESVRMALAWRTGDESPLLRNLLSVLDEHAVFDAEEHREDHRS